MRNWDIGDWFIFVIIIVGALVVLEISGMGIYLTVENDREQFMCMHAGGTIEHVIGPHSGDWNCKKNTALEFSP